MPNVSKATASETVTVDGLEVSLENFDGGYTVCFESHTADADLAPIFQGLPDDRCQFPRWGYVLRGRSDSASPTGLRPTPPATPTTCRRATPRFTTRAPKSSNSARPTSWARRSAWP